jgi:hypothetical protein
MSKRILMGAIFIFLMILFVTPMMAEEEEEKAKHEYIGAKKCKICHKKDGVFESWSATPHATAWDKLTDEQKASDEFKKYYTTGTDAKGEVLEGVQCEACHGPGSDYKKKSIMEDRKLSIENGLIIPTEETCKGCHNEKATAALAKTAKDFDMSKMIEKGIHVLKSEIKKDTTKTEG